MVECAFPSFESLIGWANVGPTFSRELSSIGSINVEGTFPRPCFSPASRVSHFCPTNIGGTDPGFRICRSFVRFNDRSPTGSPLRGKATPWWRCLRAPVAGAAWTGSQTIRQSTKPPDLEDPDRDFEKWLTFPVRTSSGGSEKVGDPG